VGSFALWGFQRQPQYTDQAMLGLDTAGCLTCGSERRYGSPSFVQSPGANRKRTSTRVGGAGTWMQWSGQGAAAVRFANRSHKAW
jgi:hypothetical protein